MKDYDFKVGDVVEGRWNPNLTKGIVVLIAGNLITVRWEGREFDSWMAPSDCKKYGN